MNIVGIAACTAGIAHTYIAREKLIAAAQEAGHTIAIETQGTIGRQFDLTDEEIEAADLVIIAADIKVSGQERFEGLPKIEVPTDVVVHSAKALISKAEEIMKE